MKTVQDRQNRLKVWKEPVKDLYFNIKTFGEVKKAQKNKLLKKYFSYMRIFTLGRPNSSLTQQEAEIAERFELNNLAQRNDRIPSQKKIKNIF